MRIRIRRKRPPAMYVLGSAEVRRALVLDATTLERSLAALRRQQTGRRV